MYVGANTQSIERVWRDVRSTIGSFGTLEDDVRISIQKINDFAYKNTRLYIKNKYICVESYIVNALYAYISHIKIKNQIF